MRPDKTARIDRLQLTASVSRKLAPILDEDVQSILNVYETNIINRMVGCKPTDDAGRRDAALELNAFRAFRAVIQAAVFSGPHAVKKLEELTANAQ